jgi:hypothetical protein
MKIHDTESFTIDGINVFGGSIKECSSFDDVSLTAIPVGLDPYRIAYHHDVDISHIMNFVPKLPRKLKKKLFYTRSMRRRIKNGRHNN